MPELNNAAKAARALFLPASILPFLIGAAYAFKVNGSIPAAKFILGLAAVGSMHLAGNLFNDYFDYKSGADNIADRMSPFFGGSQVIQRGVLRSSQVLSLSLVFAGLALGSGLGIYVLTKDAVFLFIMIMTGALTVEYTAPPLRLAYNRLGELDIFVLFGVFLVTGSFYLLTGVFNMECVVLSLPVSFLVTAIIVCNEIPDYACDRAAGKHNLISLVGGERGYTLYAATLVLSALSLVAGVLFNILPTPALTMLLFYGIGARAIFMLSQKSIVLPQFIQASALTILLHTLVGAGTILFLVIGR